MKTPQILIFDPFSSKHKDFLESIISEKAKYKTVTCRSLNELKTLTDIDWILIFVFIANDEDPEIQDIYTTILTEFRRATKIGIIKDSIACKDYYPTNNEFCNLITEPFDEQDVLHQLYKFVPPQNESKVKTINTLLRDQARYELLRGKSHCISEIRNKIHQVAPYNVNVLITGDSGTGKELCARMTHFLSPRSEKPFVAVNCGAIPKELFENELFGHKEGAYTNAGQSENGLLSAADGGTLFLDEVESLPGSAQVKLLRFLEEKKYKPLGQAAYVESDVRVIAAAKKNLYDLSKKNQFRLDLLYRLNIVQIFIPPLKDRKEDIPGLVSYFIDRYKTLHNRKIDGIKDEALMEFLQYDWPGNIRELENMIQELIVINSSGWIYPEDLNKEKFFRNIDFIPETFRHAKQKAIEDFERMFIHTTLDMFGGNIKQAANFAQKDRWAFYNLMHKYNIDPAVYRSESN